MLFYVRTTKYLQWSRDIQQQETFGQDHPHFRQSGNGGIQFHGRAETCVGMNPFRMQKELIATLRFMRFGRDAAAIICPAEITEEMPLAPPVGRSPKFPNDGAETARKAQSRGPGDHSGRAYY
jgi:hypothetical protein